MGESTRDSSEAFPDDIQKELAGDVADMEVYGKTLRVFDQKHGCLVDPEELVYSTIHGFINGSPLDESCVMNYH
ncbi:hypothetical protein ARMGADRAFT_298355 [Armillaria gallica]|uniref:Uncharacterized protein n=1 Tax=Armillaria gallica TaxID=47427 RepID=A0A2H3DG40_ARMGA|nr:hypothetical protein ARMGADRAFT_298355 [Armillaria gallica]